MPFYTNSSAGTVSYSNADWQTAGLITNGYIVDSADTGGNLPSGGTDGTTYRTPLSFPLGKYERALIRAKLDITYLDGDFKYKLTVPASSTAARIITRSSETPISGELAEVGALSTSTSGVAEVAVTAGDGDGYVLFEGFVEAGGTSGTVAIQFAQRANHANDTVLNEGSYLEYLKF
tara:strand:- start:17 stop:547 length:531 start_codon:yes stop_codon:yes gene_type:complete